MQLLLIEDEAPVARLVKRGLQAEGHEVFHAKTLAEAARHLSARELGLVIADVRLPDGDGVAFARKLREDGFRGGLLMLSALSGTRDKVRGLEFADDYLAKPFDMEELTARVRTLLRRMRRARETVLAFGGLTLDLIARRACRDEQCHDLSEKEFGVLEMLMRSPEKPVARSEIAQSVWGVNFSSDSNIVDVYVNHLRKKLDVPFTTKMIRTVVGVGYVLQSS